MLCLDLLAVRLEHPDLAAVLKGLHADAVGLLRARIEQGDVGYVDRQILVDDAAGLPHHRVGTLVLLYPVDPFDDDVLRVHPPQHGAALTLVASVEADDLVAFANALHHGTSGASETIFMNCSVRNSRVTGPKIRVPIGSIFGVSSTAALRSKRIREPSARRTPLAVRTTTAS